MRPRGYGSIMRYLALILLAAILAAVSGQGCTKQQGVVAHMTVDVTYDVLETAYKVQSAAVQVKECQDYSCNSVYDCPSLTQCPAQQMVTKAWDPVWTAYEHLATAVELGDSDGARQGYCKLQVTAGALGVKLPLPGYDCQ
jgi:hypothetical protein